MPGLSGLDVLRAIATHHPETKVILLTGHGSAEDTELGLRLGAAAHLQKPVDLDALLEAARIAVSGKGESDGQS
jgi:DNA-binding NtrC family response regulator